MNVVEILTSAAPMLFALMLMEVTIALVIMGTMETVMSAKVHNNLLFVMNLYLFITPIRHQ